MWRLELRNFQSPGDDVMLTACVRDLHLAHPGVFETDVRTPSPGIWEYNPYLTQFDDGAPGVDIIEMHYDLVHESNYRPYHFIHGFTQFLEQRLGVRIPVSQFRGDIHLSAAEKSSPPLSGHPLPPRFWIIVAGGKYDFTAKWWNPDNYQKVVDHFRGRIEFVQVGEAGHWHPPLTGVTNLIGKTTTREFIRLMHYADGVVCPVTFAMHLAAAVETRPGRPKNRACVVIAGGREPTNWEAYPHHRYLSLVGALSCCQDGGCWKSRCQPVGDGDAKDSHDLCEQPVQITPEVRIPKCMDMITADDVIRQIETYYQGGSLHYSNGQAPIVQATSVAVIQASIPSVSRRPGVNAKHVLIRFTHGLGDAVQLTCVLEHLAKYRPEWTIDVAAQIGKHTAYAGQCRRSYVLDRDAIDLAIYDSVFDLAWWECYSVYSDSPCTKVCNCLREVFNIKPDLSLLKYRIDISEESRQKAAEYLQTICSAQPNRNRFPVVAIHYEGNTSGEKKNLPHAMIAKLCSAIRLHGYTPLILDWDGRSPLPDQKSIFCPTVGRDDLWHETGTGDAERLAALISQCALMIGIDSGPLHVAGATETPTLAIWTKHSPVQFFDLCTNVTHLVGTDWQAIPPCQNPEAAEFFKKHYSYRVYGDLEQSLIEASVELLLRGSDQHNIADSNGQAPPTIAGLPSVNETNGVFSEESQVVESMSIVELRVVGTSPKGTSPASRSYGQDYYDRNKANGLDLLSYGLWQERYGRWIVDALQLQGQRVLDVGCACGSMLRGICRAGADVEGIDFSEFLIQLGREHWPDVAPRLWVMDAANLSAIPDETYDVLHSCVVAEHWIPEQVPQIFEELYRVLKPGGHFYCAYESTVNSMAGGHPPEDEPTHICLRPQNWWQEHLRQTGWEVVSDEWRDRLHEHPDSFFAEYQWTWFVARRPAHESPTSAAKDRMKVLINFRHGLGDAVQLTTVLRHLQKYRPDWSVDVSTLVGKHSAFYGLCNKVYVQGQDSPPCCQYQQTYDLEWHECHTSYGDSPSTKAERCLRDEFGIAPDPELCRYSIRQSDEAKNLAREYLERVCQTKSTLSVNEKYPAVLIHYEGNTSGEKKNIPTEIIRRLCDEILEVGYTPIILDWDRRTSLAHAHSPPKIHCPDVHEPLWRGTGTGDAESLAALIELSTLMIGVDSGPLHAAGATSTPTLGVWTQHHPLHYFGHADNVTHLVPHTHIELIRGNQATGEAYFTKHYHYQTYRDLGDALRVAVGTRLADSNGRVTNGVVSTNGATSNGAANLIFTRDYWIRTDNGEQDLVVVQDVAEEDSYRIDDIKSPISVVVDIGGHIGCFSKRFHQRHPQARIFAIECCPENIPVLHKNIGEFASVIQAAATYEPQVALLNAVYTNCRSTGGSTLVARDALEQQVAEKRVRLVPNENGPSEYWADFREIRTVTLEDLMSEGGFDRIDVLKLDCEGSEFSILGSTPSLDRIGLIVGEYHGRAAFDQLVEDRFAGWELKILREGDLGTFWLSNPHYRFEDHTAQTHGRNGKAKTVSQSPPREHRSTTSSEFRDSLAAVFHPSDIANFEAWLPYYESLFRIVQEWQPRNVVEIGVQAGYSAFTMFLASPEANILGIVADSDEHFDHTHGGRQGLWRHAREILRPFNFHLLLADSYLLHQLPDSDLVFIGGDQSPQGCLADLNLAKKSTDRILVGNFNTNSSIRKVCDTFAAQHSEFAYRKIDVGPNGFMLFERILTRSERRVTNGQVDRA